MFSRAGLGLSSFSSFRKKWADQCEVCGLEKKVTLKVRHFALDEIAPTKKR